MHCWTQSKKPQYSAKEKLPIIEKSRKTAKNRKKIWNFYFCGFVLIFFRNDTLERAEVFCVVCAQMTGCMTRRRLQSSRQSLPEYYSFQERNKGQSHLNVIPTKQTSAGVLVLGNYACQSVNWQLTFLEMPNLRLRMKCSTWTRNIWIMFYHGFTKHPQSSPLTLNKLNT